MNVLIRGVLTFIWLFFFVQAGESLEEAATVVTPTIGGMFVGLGIALSNIWSVRV